MLRLIISLSLLLSSCAAKKIFFITAPNIFRSNVEENVLVSVFGTADQIPMTVKLTTSEGSVLATKNVVVEAGQPKTVSFLVNAANLPADEEIPTVNVRAFSSSPQHNFDKNVNVLVTTKNQVVFIQTDKPIYTPNQEVKIRVISLNEELQPTDRKVRLDVITPAGAIIDRRDDLTTHTGYITEIFPFSSYPTFGIWSVVVYYGLNYNWNSTVEFELREYVLPTFEVTIEAPKQILPSDNAITAVVTARYVYKKEVKGTAQVQMSVVKNGDTLGEFPPQAEELNINGKAIFTVQPDGDWFSKFKGGRLRIEAVVTERATGDRENTTISRTKFVEHVYTFKRDRTVSHFKKGTTFDIKIDLFHSDGTPGDDVPTKVDAYGININGVRKKLTGTKTFSLERKSNMYGQVDFRVDVNQDTESIDVTIETLDEAYPKEANDRYQFTILPIESPSEAYLQIRVPPGEIQVTQNFEVEIVKSGSTPLIGLNYIVVVRGKIVQQISDLDSNLGTLKTIRIHITSDMVPSARLIVYSFANDNVVVADSILLDIVDECKSQLIVNPDDSIYAPGDTAEFTIIAQPGSQVALLAVDEAVYFLKDFHRLTRKKMFQRMENLDLGCGPGGGANSRDVFEMAGMVAMTNANFDRTNSREGYGCPMLSERRRKRELNGNRQSCFDEFKSNTTLCSACEDGFLNIPGKTCEQRIKKFAKRKAIVIPDEIGSPPVLTILDPVIVVFYNCCLFKQAERDSIIGRSGGSDVDIVEDEDLVNVRSNFLETWIFEEHSMDDRQKQVVYSVPDSITNWIVQASSVSSTMGMCVADEESIRVFKDVFLQLKMPYSIIRGEQTQVQATLFNYGSRELTANVYMYGRHKVCSESPPGAQGPEHQLIIPQNDAKTTTFNIIPLDLGTYEIEIKVFSNNGNDGIKKTILVVAEGVERYHSTTILIDPTGARESIAENGEAQEKDVPLDNEFPFKPETFTDRVEKIQTDTMDIQVSDLNAIVGTEKCYVTFFGDIMTPTVSSVINGLNPGSLIGKPMGCGEQTMMYMSANVYTMLYLSKTNQITKDIEANGFENVKRSYQRMINYQRDDGAFAAWTSRQGSTWLTAYTVKVFYNVLELGKFVDKNKLCAAFRFFETRYRNTGVLGQGLFSEGNPVIHSDMTGGISGDLMMTAFVVITLKEYNPANLEQASQTNCKVDYTDKITKAIAYLEANVDTLKTSYHLSVVAYALHVAGSELKDDAWTKLKLRASFDPQEGLRHWNMNSKALTVEATSYALLIAVYRNEIVYANGIVNWLTVHRDFKRGFSTTSDTAIAFESIATYSSEIDTSSVNMRCKLTSTSSTDFEQIVEINNATSTLSQRKPCPVDGVLVVECKGDGIAQAQVEVIYNSLAETEAEKCAFFIYAEMSSLQEGEDIGNDKDYTMRITVNYQTVLNGKTDMVIVEVGLFSGFTPVEETLKMLEKSDGVPVERYEISDRKVILYLEYLEASKIVNLEFRVKESFKTKNIQSARVAVYDYYFPEKICTAFYNPKDDQTELRQFCEGDVCMCAADACPVLKHLSANDIPTYDQLYHDKACGPKSSIDYVFEVVAQAKETKNGFVTLTATVQTVMKRGKDTTIEEGISTRLFSMKSSCVKEDEDDLIISRKYLIMGKDGLSYKDGNFVKYKYLLDSTSYIEKWPKKSEDKKRAWLFNKLKKTLKKEGCAA